MQIAQLLQQQLISLLVGSGHGADTMQSVTMWAPLINTCQRSKETAIASIYEWYANTTGLSGALHVHIRALAYQGGPFAILLRPDIYFAILPCTGNGVHGHAQVWGPGHIPDPI